jgi:hypothetical protein
MRPAFNSISSGGVGHIMAAPNKRVRSTALWAVLALFGIMMVASLTTASGIDPGASTMQDDEADPNRVLTFEQPILYMYGDDSEGDRTQWTTWNHAESNDGQSATSFFEGNLFGDANAGGGIREFTFDGTDANENATGIDAEQPITGTLNLAINCSGCSKEVTLTLRIGAQNGLADMTSITLAGPDEVDGDIYTYSFEGHNIDELEGGEVFGIRLQFTKSSGITDSYTLSLGRDNFEMIVPVLPPYEEEVPGLELEEGKDYVSPYAVGTAGFTTQEVAKSGIGGPILMILVSIGIVAGIMFLMPPTGIYKVLTVVLVGIGMIASFTIIPIISGPVALATAVDESDPNVYSIDDIAAMQERDGTFLGELTAGTEFQVYIPYDMVYRARDLEMNGWHYGLGFESSAETLSDPAESSSRGREYVQLYFSMTDVDLIPGSAIILNVKMINATDSAGESRVVPQWAVPGDEGNQFWVKDDTFGGRWVIPEKDINGDTNVEVVGVKYTWQNYPLLMTLLGFILGGVGLFQWTRARRPARSGNVDDLDDDDYEEDFDDDDFDFDDDDL